MALLTPHLHRFHYNSLRQPASPYKTTIDAGGGFVIYPTYSHHRCSAIAIDSPSSLTGVTPIRWGYTSVQGFRDEMEDDIVIRSEALDSFSFAAVFDGHAGSSSVKFLRLETNGEEDESGSTAKFTYFSVLSRSGQIEELTDSHRPYGSSKSAVQGMKRIKDAGGWIVNGRICGDIAVSRAFGDIRFKTKKHEMLKKGVDEGRWSEKFVSRIEFKGDMVVATPDIYQVPLTSDVEFIILASDGLWDYMKSKDVVSFVREQLRKHGWIQASFSCFHVLTN